MKSKLFQFFRHALTMVGRSRRSYSMLSVTIVLSFSLLLGFLGWTDSSLYNAYKGVFHQDRNLVFVQSSNNNRSLIELLKEKAEEYGTVHDMEILVASNMAFTTFSIETEDGNPISWSSPICCYCIPRHSWMFFEYPAVTEVTWLDGEEHPDIDLKPGEILMDEQLYYALGLNLREDPEFFCDLSKSYLTAEDSRIVGRFSVVGTIPGSGAITVEVDEDSGYAKLMGYPKLVFSQSDVNPEIYPDLDWSSYIAFYTDNPENIAQLARSMNLGGVSATYEQYNDAVAQMQAKTGTKAAIAAALLVLLGINLYGSFANALNDRKFEIGVKRAIGASGFQIVRQFLYESLFVMCANILLSIWLVVTAGLAYKVIYEHIPNEYGQYFTFTLYISPSSIAMFAACAISLTVVFSLIFSYKSTQVQVVDYLKAE